MENETLLRIIMPALTGSLFGGLAGVVVTFALSPAKDLRYALTQLYADIMYHHPVLHCRCGAGNYQAEARKDIRRAASQVFAAYVRVYSNSIGIYPPEEGYNPESEAYLQADIQKICLLLSQTVESMWSKYGRKNVSG
jgi:hypothetical protein